MAKSKKLTTNKAEYKVVLRLDRSKSKNRNEKMLARHEKRAMAELVDSLNAYYANGPDEDETRIMEIMQRFRRPFLADNPW